jgi:outer membrane protein assembly factor BamB
VVWAGGADTSLTLGLGLVDDRSFATVSDRKLVGIDLETGTVRWTLEGDEPVEAALFDKNQGVMYTINQLGDLAVYNWPVGTSPPNGLLTGESLGLQWGLELEDIGTPRLFPGPDGGVIVALPRVLIDVSANGEIRWRESYSTPIQNWERWGERLVYTFSGGAAGLWAAGDTGPVLLAGGISGLPVRSGERSYLYDPEGIYRVDGEGLAEMLYALPRAFPTLGDLVVMPGGDLLLAHMDRADRRLAAFGPDGNLRWERSVATLPAGRLRLTVLKGTAYLSVVDSNSPSHQLYLYAVDQFDGELLYLFTGGNRSSLGDEAWLYPLETGQLLIHIGGGSLVVFDPDLARETLLAE